MGLSSTFTVNEKRCTRTKSGNYTNGCVSQVGKVKCVMSMSFNWCNCWSLEMRVSMGISFIADSSCGISILEKFWSDLWKGCQMDVPLKEGNLRFSFGRRAWLEFTYQAFSVKWSLYSRQFVEILMMSMGTFARAAVILRMILTYCY